MTADFTFLVEKAVNEGIWVSSDEHHVIHGIYRTHHVAAWRNASGSRCLCWDYSDEERAAVVYLSKWSFRKAADGGLLPHLDDGVDPHLLIRIGRLLNKEIESIHTSEDVPLEMAVIAAAALSVLHEKQCTRQYCATRVQEVMDWTHPPVPKPAPEARWFPREVVRRTRNLRECLDHIVGGALREPSPDW